MREDTLVRPVVWVVDDSALDAQRAGHALAPLCDVRLMYDGSAVLEELTAGQPPDVLVLDWVMPGLTGVEVVRFMRSEGQLPEVPVLLLTAHHESAQIVEGLASGANDFLAKPFNEEELRARVGALLRSAALLRRAQSAEKALRGLLSHAPDALLAVNAQGRVLYANDEAGQVFDTLPQALLGRALQELAPGLSLRTISIGGGEPLVPLPDVVVRGRVFSPSVRILPTDDAATTTVALRDVTERRKTEQQRNDFYAIIAQDLRAPLNAMILRTELILKGRRGPLSPGLHADLQQFDRSFRSMVAMINDFLELARLEGAGFKIHRDPVSLAQLVEGTVRELQPLADANNIELRWKAEGPRATVRADAQRLAQVIATLLGNAVHVTPSGGKIALELRETPASAELRVSDSGPGIPPELLPAVFDRPARVGQGGGPVSGFGLMIAREIVEAHGGTVGVRSEPGHGATFWFRLPTLQSAAAAAAAPEAERMPGVDGG